MKFKTKTIEKEAIQYLGPFSIDEMVDVWPEFKKHYAQSNIGILKIRTLEGDHFASIGDWIIKGIKGEFYPCKPEIFEMTYEPVNPKERSDE